MAKILLFIMLLFMLAIITLFAIFLSNENKRDELILKYSKTASILNDMATHSKGEVGQLFESGEVLVCALNSYFLPNNSFDHHQLRSISKEDFPSQDLSWYLIFFNEKKHTRVYMFDHQDVEIKINDRDYCFGKKDYFSYFFNVEKSIYHIFLEPAR